MPTLTAQEARVLDHLASDPFLTQQDLAVHLGSTRSTVATHIRSLVGKGYIEGRAYVLSKSDPGVLCVGGINVDVAFRLDTTPVQGTSNIGTATETPGGVARNVAEAVAVAGTPAILLGPIGDDARGRTIIKSTTQAGVECTGIVVRPGETTGVYTAVIGPDGGLVIGLNDMHVLDTVAWNDIRPTLSQLARTRWMFVDANLQPDVIAAAVAAAVNAKVSIAADAVSIPKAHRLAESRFDLLFCNLEEASVLLGTDSGSAADAAQEFVNAGHKAAVVTDGSLGAWWADQNGSGHCPTIDAVGGDVTGAGDSLIAGTLASLCQGSPLADAVTAGIRLASQALNLVGASHAVFQESAQSATMENR